MFCFKVKIIYFVCLLLIFVKIMKCVNSYEIAAFEQFLQTNYIHDGIVVRNGRIAPTRLEYGYYEKLLQNYRMQYFRVGVESENFTNLFYYGSPRVGIFVTMALPGDYEIALHNEVFRSTSVGGYFNNTQAWFIVMEAHCLSRIQIAFAKYNINIDADITFGIKTYENKSLALYDVFRVSSAMGTPLRIQLKGYWSLAAGFKLFDEFLKSRVQRRRDFAGIALRATTALLEKPAGWQDLDYLSNDKNNLELDPMQRKTYQLLFPMQQMFNLSFNISFTNTWGTQSANGSWSGAMGQLVNNEADVSLCPLRFQLDRLQAIQFTPELHTQFIHFLFRHPRRNEIRNIFFEPLSNQVWWCVLALIIFAACLLTLHVKLEWRTKALPPQHLEQRLDFPWFIILETIFQQGSAADIFHLISTRMLILAVCIFGFMLLQFYGAYIVGSLLSDTPRNINDLRTLYASDFEIGMEDVPYNYLLFTNTTNQLVKDIYTKRICRNRGEQHILSIKSGTERIKAGGFAFHAAIDRMYRILIGDWTMKYDGVYAVTLGMPINNYLPFLFVFSYTEILNEREFCDLQEIMFNPPYTSSAGIPKSSPLREYFAFTILHLRATGLMQHNDKVWIVPKLDCSLIKGNEVDVDLVHFAPALCMLVIAMLASLLLLLLEFIYARRHRVN